MAKIIIVGTGAAGAAAALELAQRGLHPLVLDVGHLPAEGAQTVRENLYDYREKNDTFNLFIGTDRRGIGNVLGDDSAIAKLNAPFAEFVTRDAETLNPIETHDFHPVQSFALGGLANAWGAGLYRLNDSDLDGFPLRAAELSPYYERLTAEIGISGVQDDLAPFFGSAEGLMPPLALSHNAGRVLQAYTQKRNQLHRAGIFIGRPRLGVLSLPKDDRPACPYDNLEFWQSAPHIYSPAITLQRLAAAGAIDYRPGLLVQRWDEDENGVRVAAIETATGAPVTFNGRKLILAAGAIGTTKIVLQSAGDTATQLPLRDNPALQVPFVMPASIGRALDRRAFGLTQLNLVWESPPGRVQASILEITSPMRAEFFGRFPLSARANLTIIRQVLPAMLVMQIFFPGAVGQPTAISLTEYGRLRITGHPNPLGARDIAPLLGHLRSLGLWTAAPLIVRVPPGHSIHYAASLPMRANPGRYETHPDGRLAGTRTVYIADSAAFTHLPAKNMSFGMMANAMRVAENAATN